MSASDRHYAPRPQNDCETVPFTSGEEAWFWFIQAQAATNDGAQLTQGRGLTPRPCEPVDILRVLDRLMRQRLLIKDHLIVLRHYGRRLMPPDPRRVNEMRAGKIWREALSYLEDALVIKGIVARPVQGHLFKGVRHDL